MLKIHLLLMRIRIWILGPHCLKMEEIFIVSFFESSDLGFFLQFLVDIVPLEVGSGFRKPKSCGFNGSGSLEVQDTLIQITLHWKLLKFFICILGF